MDRVIDCFEITWCLIVASCLSFLFGRGAKLRHIFVAKLLAPRLDINVSKQILGFEDDLVRFNVLIHLGNLLGTCLKMCCTSLVILVGGRLRKPPQDEPFAEVALRGASKDWQGLCTHRSRRRERL